MRMNIFQYWLGYFSLGLLLFVINKTLCHQNNYDDDKIAFKLCTGSFCAHVFLNGIVSQLHVCVLQVQPPQWVGGTLLPHALCWGQHILCFWVSWIQQFLLLEGASARTGPGHTALDTHTHILRHLRPIRIDTLIFVFSVSRGVEGFSPLKKNRKR